MNKMGDGGSFVFILKDLRFSIWTRRRKGAHTYLCGRVGSARDAFIGKSTRSGGGGQFTHLLSDSNSLSRFRNFHQERGGMSCARLLRIVPKSV